MSGWDGSLSRYLLGHTAFERASEVQRQLRCEREGRSDQNPAMWRECGPHVLAHELAVLRPAPVIVLGRGDNARAFKRLFPYAVGAPRSPTVKAGRGLADLEFETRAAPFGPVDVLVTPHPAARGGTARAIIAAVRATLEGAAEARRSGRLAEKPAR